MVREPFLSVSDSCLARRKQFEVMADQEGAQLSFRLAAAALTALPVDLFDSYGTSRDFTTSIQLAQSNLHGRTQYDAEADDCGCLLV